jgi:hypothetical protein
VQRLALVSLLAAAPIAAHAQSSEFGVRGLGFPGREQSARASGTAGAFAFFDGQSSLNPASLAYLGGLTAGFTLLGDYRSSTDPAGTTSLRDPRFPQFMVGGPIPRRPFTVGLSYSNYTTRDYSLTFPDTIVLRGALVGVTDTIESRGGINDFRLAVAYRPAAGWSVGVGAHIITGADRMRAVRAFSDTLYRTSVQRAELSFAGFGASIGVVGQIVPSLGVAAVFRSDGHLSVKQDSLEVSRVDLPITVGGAIRWRIVPKLDFAGQVLARNWSTANADLVGAGGVGAVSTFEAAGGFEYTPNPRRPFRRPLRIGFRYAELPFPLSPGATASEFGVAVGSGLTFAADRGGIDVAVERAWRRQDDQFNERAWLITAGVTVRP